MTIGEKIQVFILGVTAVGVILILWQIRQSKQQSITSFEDTVSNEYRQITKDIPVEALLGEEIDDSEFRKCLNHIYNYIDFTNEQVFLRQQNRIRENTWKNWCEGIKSNLGRPVFKKAWEYIKSRTPTNFFSELRRLETEKFESDPINWK